MRSRAWCSALCGVLVVSFLAVAGSSSASAGPSSRPQAVCGVVPSGVARCFAQVVATANAVAPSGLNPADLRSAYDLPSASAGAGQTVAIVDAYDDPNAESDLSVYRSQFGLP